MPNPRSAIVPSGLLAALLLAGAAIAAPERVTLRPSGPAQVSFDVEVPAPVFGAAALDLGLLGVTLDGYQVDGRPGTPGLPARVVLVAVPPEGAVTLQSGGDDPSTREGVVLAPVPAIGRDADGTTVQYDRDAAAYAAHGPLAAARARLVGVSWLRNQRVAEVAILPLDYDPAARRLTVWRRVHVEVTTDGDPAARVPAERVDAFEGVYRETVVNYEQGRTWRRPMGSARAVRPGRAGAEPTAVEAVPDTSVFVGRSWVKFRIPASGLYKVDYGTVRNMTAFATAGAVPLASLRLFTWPGYPLLPEASYCDTCDYHEVPIGISDDGDGQFRTNTDYIYFYALGPNDWANVYDATWPDSSYIEHPYDTANYYFLGVSTAAQPIPGTPLRIPIVAADSDTLAVDSAPTSIPARTHNEFGNEYYADSPPVDFATFNGSGTADSLVWQKWFWLSVGQGDSRQATFDLPGADLTQPVRVKIRCWGLTVPPRGGYVLNSLDARLNGVAVQRQDWPVKTSITVDTTLSTPLPAGNLLQLSNVSSSASSRIGLGWIEARYQRTLAPDHDTLSFELPAGGGRTLLHLGPFRSASAPLLFDVTDPMAPVQLAGFHYLGADTAWQMVFVADGTRLRRYRVLPAGSFGRLSAGSGVVNASNTSLANLRRLGADYLVIYYDAFAAAADSLAEWRRGHLPLSGVSAPYVARAVPVSALYDQFSGGRTDPLAIRNFLRAVFFIGDTTATHGRRVSYVTLLGDASYDFRDFYRQATFGQPGCLLPTYENGYDPYVLGGHKFTTDDWLTNVDLASVILPDVFAGRIPVSGDPAGAVDVVRNKLLLYERQAPLGEYRDGVMLIADDNVQCQTADPIAWGHVSQTADVDTLSIPNHMDRTYVYLHTYPTLPTCAKPGARADIQNTINRGVAFVNFIGHGSPVQLADEQVMFQTDVGTFTNSPRFHVFLAASCDVGLFDDPKVQSLGERLLMSTAGGAVGVLSSTQLALSRLNADLNNRVYQKLFARDTVSGEYHVTLAEALLTAKILGQPGGGLTNNIKYQLLGDAATRPNLPHLWVELALEDSLGAPLAALPRGSLVRFTGLVTASPGGSAIPLDGKALMVIEDSAPYDATPSGFSAGRYYFRAGPVYRGPVAIQQGVLRGSFVVPLEAREGARGRVRAYVEGRGTPGRVVDDDGVGDLRVPVTAGGGAPPDSSGPRIALSFPGGATQVRKDAVLEIRISDPSGVLITDHVPQNGIVVTVDGNTTSRIDVTSSFAYDVGSYQSGAALFTLPNLAAGPHQIEVSAADNLATGFVSAEHRSRAGISFTVMDVPPLQIAHAFLYPDPACSRCPIKGGQFIVDVPGDPINLLLKIYTVSGRLVRTLETFNGQGRVQLPWNGLDEEGQPLANGVYLFRVNVNARDADGRSSASQTAAGEGRFVILNR